MRRDEAARIRKQRGRSARGENARGGLLAACGELRNLHDGARPLVRAGPGGRGEIARNLRVLLLAQHRQHIGILRLALRKPLGSGHGPAQRLVVNLVRGGARDAPVEHGAHGNGERLLGDVLVNRVVRESRQRIHRRGNIHFGFVGLGEAQDFFRDAVQLRIRRQMRGRDGGPGRAALAACGGFARGAHDLAKAAPSLMLRKREGEAPWPVPIVCMGWPLPQLGVPQSVQ